MPVIESFYESWIETVRRFRHEIAVVDTTLEKHWTFAQLAAEAERTPSSSEQVAFPQGITVQFILELLAAWREQKISCPLEAGQSFPSLGELPVGIAHIKLTSASTGPAKQILFTAKQLAADAENIVSTMGLRPEWPNLAVISMAHSYGFSNLILPLVLHGIPLVIASAPLPEVILNAAKGFEGITLPAVPALWRTWLHARAIPLNIKIAISAGAPLPCELEGSIYNHFGLKVHNFYGSSECGGIAYDGSELPRTDNALAGSAMKNVHLKITDDGTLSVQSAAVGESYWPEPQPNLQKGIFTTQDLAEISGTSIYLRGRLSEVINVAGRKIAPETIEHALRAHPSIRECLIFGIPGPESRGELIVGCVNGTAEPANLVQFLSARLPAWQIPRLWWFTSDLEPNQRGKFSRAEWRQKYLARGATRPT